MNDHQYRPVSFGAFVFFIAALFILLMPPVNDLLRASLFFLSLFLLANSGFHQGRKRIFLGLCSVFLIALMKLFLPIALFEETHNVFFTKGSTVDEPWRKILPPHVLEDFTLAFNAAYPPDRRCDDKVYGCWQIAAFPDNPMAWSADNFWGRHETATRRVMDINVTDITTGRIGTVNDLRYNWYDELRGKPLSDVQRRRMPFWVSYVIPQGAQGGELCWMGDLWKLEPLTASLPAKISHEAKTCRKIQVSDLGAKIWMGFIDGEKDQSLSFTWSIGQRVLRFWDSFLSFFGVVCLWAFTLRPRRNDLMVQSAFLAAGIALFCYHSLGVLLGVVPYGGGGDGLVHASHGREIAKALFDGDWMKALRGGEDVFYFMPGLRYFIAAEHMIFGDMHFGEVMAVLFFPMLVWRLLKRLDILFWVFPILLISFFLPKASDVFGFAYRFYCEQAGEALAEPQGYILYLFGLSLLIPYIKAPRETTPAQWLCVGLLWSFAIFIRPNLVLAIGFSGVFCVLFLLGERLWSRAAMLSLGLSSISFCLIHNVMFGREWTLLTSSSTHPANLLLPPSTYIDALRALVAGVADAPAILRIGEHLLRWIGEGRTGLAHLVVLGCIVSFSVIKRSMIFKDRINFFLAVSLIGHHIPLFFFHPDGRYAKMAWFLTLILALRLIAQTEIFDRVKKKVCSKGLFYRCGYWALHQR